VNILVVEDELTSRELLKVILEPYGTIQTVADGIEAMKAFNLALAKQPYDLICLDIMLPKMDGQQVDFSPGGLRECHGSLLLPVYQLHHQTDRCRQNRSGVEESRVDLEGV
jgi:hypothetical protein